MSNSVCSLEDTTSNGFTAINVTLGSNIGVIDVLACASMNETSSFQLVKAFRRSRHSHVTRNMNCLHHWGFYRMLQDTFFWPINICMSGTFSSLITAAFGSLKVSPIIVTTLFHTTFSPSGHNILHKSFELLTTAHFFLQNITKSLWRAHQSFELSLELERSNVRFILSDS